MAIRGTSSFIAALVCVSASGCGEEPEPLLTEEALREGTYLTQFADGGRVTLKDGRYESPVVEGALPELTISLGLIATGDLNADDREDAAVVLVERMGQAETFYNLHAVLSADSALRDAAWLLVATRPVGVVDVAVDSGLIRVRLQDPPGREGEPEERSVVYALTDKGLRVVDDPLAGGAEPTERAGLGNGLSGAEWKLVAIETEDETRTPVFSSRGDPSLVFAREFGDSDLGSGRLSGHAGCNRIFGSYRVGPTDSLQITSVATTFMSCPEPVMEIERLLVRALELMRTYERLGDDLVLEFLDGRLLFSTSDR